MAYKLIAVDLDDSLLGSDIKISPRNHEALVKAMDKGVLVTIATGRMFRSAVVFARQLGLDVPIITYQGGLVKAHFPTTYCIIRPYGWTFPKKLLAYVRPRVSTFRSISVMNTTSKRRTHTAVNTTSK